MGSPPDEPERRPDEEQIEVILTKGFWMGKYEVTQGQWKRVMDDFPHKQPAGEGDDFPVVEINYGEAEAFFRKLTELARRTGDLPKGWGFYLPTEAQWEYACRAGTTTATSFGNKLSSKQANFQGKPYSGAEKGPSLNRATKIGSYPANAWGLHDMHGNVYEWCRDWYHQKLPGGLDPDLSSTKGKPNRDGTFSRVRRGGAWCDDGQPCRSAHRLRYEPERRSNHIGFRVVAVQWQGHGNTLVPTNDSQWTENLTEEPTSVFVTCIATAPETLWKSLTNGDFTQQYFFGRRMESDWKPSSPWKLVMADGRLDCQGKVLESDPPYRLALTWHVEWIEEMRRLPEAIVTFAIDRLGEVVRLTVSEFHPKGLDEKYAEGGRRGWPIILSGLKTLLETGRPLPKFELPDMPTE